MLPDLISPRPSTLADMQTSPQTQAEHSSNERMQPPRKGALPYTREEYRALPADMKTAALDFIIEGIIPDAKRAGCESAQTQKAMDSIVSWCIEHGEDTALEFLYRESGARRMGFTCKTLDHRAFSQMQLTLKSHPQVKLHFSYVCIRDDAASDLAELIRNGRVTALGIDCRFLSNESMCLIAQALQSANAITELTLRACKPLNKEAAMAVGEALGRNASIDKLHFSECDFGPDGWKPLLAGLQSNRHAKTLVMELCSLKNNGSAQACGQLLATSTTLKKFALTTREFDGIAEHILGGLGQSRSIEDASILTADSKIEHTESALRKCIARNPSLKRLELNHSSVPPDSVPRLVKACADAVVGNTSLHSLPFACSPETEERRIVEGALERNKALDNDPYVRKAADVFIEQPAESPAWLPEGPGDMLTRHILMRERSIADFAHTMALVECALTPHAEPAAQEQERQGSQCTMQ